MFPDLTNPRDRPFKDRRIIRTADFSSADGHELRRLNTILSPGIMALVTFSGVLACMIGNARIDQIDIVLFMILPPTLLLIFVASPSYKVKYLLHAGSLMLLTYALFLLSLRHSEIVGYPLWPVKSAIVAFVCVTIARDLRTVDIRFFACLCAALLLTSNDIYGRSYGIFGPNMLYRFYGVLFMLSLYGMNMGLLSKPTALFFAAMSILGIVQTGSAGGALLLGLGLLLFIRASNASILASAFLGLALSMTWPLISSLLIGQRLLGKVGVDAIIYSTRGNGILQILEQDVLPFGLQYSDFHHIWSFGYTYPHNVLVELYAFFGLVGLALAPLILAAFMISISRIRAHTANIFHFIFIAVFVGSNLSGDLSDNYAVVALAFAIPFMPQGQASM